MVNFSVIRKLTISVFVFCSTMLTSCGIQYYNDFDSRFDWHDDVRFSAPSLLPDEDYSFIVISDIHITNEQDAQRFAEIKTKLETNDKFIVITGDITQNGTKNQFKFFLNAVSSIGIPCYPVIGNHDIYADRGKYWKELIGSTVYRLDSSDTSLFFLDNANGAFGYEQLEWFENEIKTAEKTTFVFTHENFFVDSSPPDIEQNTDIRERARVMALLKKRCSIMFMGHLHKRIIKEFDGVTYIISEASESANNYCRVHVSKAGISWEFGS